MELIGCKMFSRKSLKPRRSHESLPTPWELTLRRPLRKKLRMRWFFDASEVKESIFFKSDLTDPPSDFWCASFGKYQFRPCPSIRPLKNFVLIKKCEKKWSISNRIMVFTKLRKLGTISRTLIGWWKLWRHEASRASREFLGCRILVD